LDLKGNCHHFPIKIQGFVLHLHVKVNHFKIKTIAVTILGKFQTKSKSVGKKREKKKYVNVGKYFDYSVGAFLPSFHHLSSLFIVRPREGATVVVPPSARLTTQKKQQLEREKEKKKIISSLLPLPCFHQTLPLTRLFASAGHLRKFLLGILIILNFSRNCLLE
jgi:hypothetical protein